jgi:hypothetical protein
VVWAHVRQTLHILAGLLKMCISFSFTSNVCFVWLLQDWNPKHFFSKKKTFGEVSLSSYYIRLCFCLSERRIRGIAWYINIPKAIVAHLSKRDVRNTMGTRGTPE